MVNKVTLLGNLGKDPELRSTQSGATVANFSIATSRKWTDKSGQKVEDTEWHSIVAWGKLAEVVGSYLSKGSRIYLEGRLQTRSWEKDGVKHYRTEVVMETLKMLGGGSGKREEEPAHAGSADDDIPF